MTFLVVKTAALPIRRAKHQAVLFSVQGDIHGNCCKKIKKKKKKKKKKTVVLPEGGAGIAAG
jgi:hypothetical protein